MSHKHRHLNLFISLILIISINFMNVSVAFADDGAPPPEETPTVAPTEVPTESTGVATEEPIEPAVEVTETPTSEEQALVDTEADVSDLLEELPENTDLVILDENQDPVSLATQEAITILEDADPMWCPEGVLPNGPGCTTNLTVSALLALMQANAGGKFNANGVIYFERSGLTTYNTAFTLDNSAGSLGASYSTISTFNITLQGGWNGGATNTFNGSQPSLFDNNNNAVVRVGSSGNPWIGNVTMQDFSIQDNTAVNNPSVAVYTTNGSVTLDNVDTDDIDNSTAINVVVTGTGNVFMTDIDVTDGTDGSGITVTTNSGNINFNNVDVDNQEQGNTANLSSQSGNINITNGSDFDGDNSGDFNQGFFASTNTGSITINGSNFTDAEGSGTGTNYNGATLSAPIVSLTNVTADDNDLNGIAITNANQVTLNDVTATNNGTDIGGGSGGGGSSNDLGSGVRVDGNPGSFVSVLDGTFIGNQRYGIEVFNSSIFIGSSIDFCQTAFTSAGCTNVAAVTDTSNPIIAFVSRTPAANGSGWNNSNVTVTWSCTDAQSGVVSSTVSQTVTTQGANQSVTGTCTNKAGRTSTNTQTGINIDKTAPGITFTSKSPAANGNGWNSTNVTVNWACTDSLSGVVSATTSQTVTTEGANQSSTGTCLDLAGNTASNTQAGINIDKTAPTSVVLTPSGTVGANGWYTSNVTITTSGTDLISGPVTCTALQSLSSDTGSTGVTFNGSCTNLAGLTTNASPLTVKRDATPPTIAFFSRTPANGSGWNNGDVTVTWSCADTSSGAVSAATSQTISTEGLNQTATGTCTDLAGNTATDTQIGINIDKTAPSASANTSPAPNSNGWNNTDVTVSFNGLDGGSGISSCSASVILSTEGAGQSASGSCTDNAGNVSTPATASGINIDKTAPTSVILSPSGTLGANGWYTSNVTITTSGTDSISGPVTCTALQSLSSDSTGATFNGSCTNLAGLTTNASPLTVKRDATPPTIDFFSRTPANGNGWNNGDVTVTWSCADTSSGAVNATTSQTISTEGSNQTATGTCTDLAGNTATDTQIGINIDKTAPSASTNASPAPNANGWNNTDVTVSFNGLDGGSGISSCSASVILSTEGAGQSVSGSCTDNAGNVSTPATASGINIDKTAPSASASASPAPNSNGWNNSSVTVSFSGSDALSGIDFCDADMILTSEGAGQSASGTCTDNAGNVSPSAAATGINIDTTKPALNLPADITVEATGSAGATVNYVAGSADNLDPAPIVDCVLPSGSTFGLGTSSVTCTSTDQADNDEIGQFDVTVEDTTPPAINSVSTITATTSGIGTIVTFASPAYSDIVDGSGIATCASPSGSFFPIGTTTVTCTATDNAGNSASISFTIQVNFKKVAKPNQPVLGTALSIPVTGGSLIDLQCLSVVNAHDVKITFHNLCEHQATIALIEKDTLPAVLPDGFTFVNGLDVLVLDDGQLVDALPNGTGVQLDFPIPASTQAQYAVLYWHDENKDGNGEWVEVSNLVNIGDLSKIMVTDAEDELYKISPTDEMKAFYQMISTEETGIFVIVKK